jgi:DNA-binding beta-propeller fold protein YncE
MFKPSRDRSIPAAVGAALAAGAALIALLVGCAIAPPAAEVRPVWPAPPLPARIEFLRTIASEEDVNRDTTFSETLVEFFSGKKPPSNHLAEPMGIAVSDDGNRVYVADYGQLDVFVFDFEKKSVTRVGQGTPLGRPIGLALDNDENLYVVEQEKKGISVFDRSGKLVRFITDASIEKPDGVAIDRARGKLYLADASHSKSTEHTVKIFDLQGKLLGALGKGKGSKPGEFLFPTYVTVDPLGSVYVTDTLNSRVQVFDTDGNYVRSFGQRGNSWGMFDKPKGVALDNFGNLYVVDSGWSNVQIFNQKGAVLLFFGGNGRNPGLLWAPTAIAIDKRNRIFVADNLNHRVEMYQLINTTASDSDLVPPAAPGARGAPAAPAKAEPSK